MAAYFLASLLSYLLKIKIMSKNKKSGMSAILKIYLNVCFLAFVAAALSAMSVGISNAIGMFLGLFIVVTILLIVIHFQQIKP